MQGLPLPEHHGTPPSRRYTYLPSPPSGDGRFKAYRAARPECYRLWTRLIAQRAHPTCSGWWRGDVAVRLILVGVERPEVLSHVVREQPQGNWLFLVGYPTLGEQPLEVILCGGSASVRPPFARRIASDVGVLQLEQMPGPDRRSPLLE
jgi:hypothetical protein